MEEYIEAKIARCVRWGWWVGKPGHRVRVYVWAKNAATIPDIVLVGRGLDGALPFRKVSCRRSLFLIYRWRVEYELAMPKDDGKVRYIEDIDITVP